MANVFFFFFRVNNGPFKKGQVAIQQVCRSRNDAKRRKHLRSEENLDMTMRCTDWFITGPLQWLTVIPEKLGSIVSYFTANIQGFLSLLS